MFAEELADIVDDTQEYDIVAFVENWEKERVGMHVLDLPVVWVDDLVSYADECLAICSIGSTKRKGFIEQVESIGLDFATIMHPSSRLSTKSTLGKGSFMSVNSVVASHTEVGNHVIINRGALVGHHAKVENYVTISPGVKIGGATHIKSQAYIGMGSTILERVTIGSNSIVGAGSVVTKDVPDNTLVMGIPARVVKENIDGK